MSHQSADFSERFPLAADVIQQGIERGLHFGAQVSISQHGNVLADAGIGLAAPGVPMTSETVNPWLSSGKPLTAVLIAQLQEQGRLDWNDPVMKFVPEFGSRGKESITLRHLLTHTAGLRSIDAGWPEVDWHESLQRICDASIAADWVVGETAGYDPVCNWFVLGEIIQRICGRNFSDVLFEEVFQPCSMDHSWAALTESQTTAAQANLGWMWERVRGQLESLNWHKPPRVLRPSPGSSLCGPIRELGKFYEAILKASMGPSGFKLSRESLQTITSRQRIGARDRTFGHVVDFGFGFIIDSNQYGDEKLPYGFGRFCSPRTFGHGGAQSSQGYCDPEHGLVVAYVFNGRPGEPQHQRRAKAFNEAIYRDLGLARG